MPIDRIPIHYTHAEARAWLERMHAVDYDSSTLGTHTRAVCACGWRSRWSIAGFTAQDAERQHLIAAIEHPLYNRARYAIFWQMCAGCNGTGRFESPDGVDLGRCAQCYDGGGWRLLDRSTGGSGLHRWHWEAVERLDREHLQEPTA